MPEEAIVEEEESFDLVSNVQPSDNPSANGWYELSKDAEGWETPTLSSDTTPSSNKDYYIKSQGGVSNMSEAAVNAISTFQTYLVYRTTSSGSYTKVVDIKDYPDMEPEPNLLDATTLSDGIEKKIPGIKRMSDNGLQFTANYTKENYAAVKELENHQYEYGLWFGGTSAGVPDGHNGKFTWTGDIRASYVGKGVDEVQEMRANCYPASDPVWSAE